VDQIRPIGPVERDIEPVFAAQRLSRDGEGGQRREREEQPRRAAQPPPAPPPDDEPPADGGSLIDVRV
jgi:hypothetical protein